MARFKRFAKSAGMLLLALSACTAIGLPFAVLAGWPLIAAPVVGVVVLELMA
jgi:hypothetical protein